MDSITFGADGVRLKPPTVDGNVRVELTTGEYEMDNLQEMYSWQRGDNQSFKVTIERIVTE